jgi:hypothetical protein
MAHWFMVVLAVLFLSCFTVTVVWALGWKMVHGIRLITEALSDLWNN